MKSIIQFDYGGHYSEEHEWISSNPLCGILLKSVNITYSALVKSVCKKMTIDETSSKLKLSYKLCKTRRETYIVDDYDVSVFLVSVDDVGFRPVLNVELIKDLEELEQISRMDGTSSMGVNHVGLGVNDAENGASGVLTVFGGVNVEERYEPVNRGNELIMENQVFEDREYVDNRIDNEEDNGVDGRHEYVELPCSGETIQQSQKVLEWEDGTGIEIGQEFVSKEAVQDVVNRAANKYCFATKTLKSEPTRLTLRCRQFSGGCQWYLYAAKGKNSDCFKVKVYRSMHTCDRSDPSTTDCKKTGTPRLIASVLHEDYADQLETPKPKNIMGIVRGRLGLNCSYSTAWRGKKQHVSDVRGSPEKSYTDLHSYLYMLEEVNPGTVTSVEVDAENRFKYLFIALGACIEGFQVMRKVIIMDATFLKTIYGGMLVFATAQDPNHHNYIIAFGVIDKENDASWSWFLRKLKTVVPDEPGLVFMSDRHQSIIKYVAQVFPNAKHGFCVWHMSQNVRGRVKKDKDEAAKAFRDLAHVYTDHEFRIEYEKFRRRFPGASLYLDNLHKDKLATVDKWARCYFDGEKYNIDTSNACESLNNTFKPARKYYLLPMIDAVLEKIAEWFNTHRKDACEAVATKKLVPFVENVIHTLCPKARPLAVFELNSYEREYNVTASDGKTFYVNLMSKSCSCRCFDIDKYPCIHAIAAARNFVGNTWRTSSIAMHDLCSHYYWLNSWVLAYSRTILLVPHVSTWSIPDEIKEKCVLPPEYTSKPGRNQETRFPSIGESRRKRRNKYQPGVDLDRFLEPDSPGHET